MTTSVPPYSIEEIERIRNIPMFFVLGKERSGTTLLQLMLNAHANIVAPPESRFIILLYFRYGKTKQWTEKIISDLCEDLYKEGLFRDFWGVDKQELISVLLAVKDKLTYPLLCKIIFRLSSPDKKDVCIFFDKNPLYYYFLPELKRIFPEAKYIHLVRDYRANLVSHKKVFTVKKGTDIAFRWMKVNMLVEEAKKQAPQNYLTLRYEDLVSNPTQNMEDVCRFLNLPFDPNMVQNHQSGMYSNFNSNKKEGFLKVHQNVFNPINPSLINEWKEKISADELLNVESAIGNYAETMYGYLPINPISSLKNKPIGYFMMNLKYKMIKALYKKALANFTLYWFIKKNLWGGF
jgi:Sulfotransferase family